MPTSMSSLALPYPCSARFRMSDSKEEHCHGGCYQHVTFQIMSPLRFASREIGGQAIGRTWNPTTWDVSQLDLPDQNRILIFQSMVQRRAQLKQSHSVDIKMDAILNFVCKWNHIQSISLGNINVLIELPTYWFFWIEYCCCQTNRKWVNSVIFVVVITTFLLWFLVFTSLIFFLLSLISPFWILPLFRILELRSPHTKSRRMDHRFVRMIPGHEMVVHTTPLLLAGGCILSHNRLTTTRVDQRIRLHCAFESFLYREIIGKVRIPSYWEEEWRSSR